MPAQIPYIRPVVHAGTYPKRRRKEQPMMTVWSPAGEEEVHTVLNARDLIRNNHYTTSPPVVGTVPSVPSEPASVSLADSVQDSVQDPVSEAPKMSPALAELNKMRDELRDLTGVEPDSSWGKGRLTAALHKARSEKAREKTVSEEAPGGE